MMPTVWPFVSGIAVCAALVPLLIAWQRARSVGQEIYEDGPTAHRAKQGTPTMGGLAFLAAALLAGLVLFRNGNDERLLILAGGAGLIGAVDDLLILVNRRALGLRARAKFTLLAVLAAVYLIVTPHAGGPPATTERWFGGDVDLPSWLWWVLSLLAIVGSANAVNLTDGLDGLAAGSALAPLAVLSLAALSPMAAAVLGACVAFLYFNRHPARIFMGDAGSLLLGALLAGLAIQSGWLLLLPLIGAVFVAEALSVMAQVVSFKLTGRRVFKMSPLHHHFELSDWPEWRVTSTFIAVSSIATAAVAYALFATSDAYRSLLQR